MTDKYQLFDVIRICFMLISQFLRWFDDFVNVTPKELVIKISFVESHIWLNFFLKLPSEKM